eukprot:TRINITY_DN5182_c0_g7_i1.p1 TRINITY_DN5182_c0_g7~~TRINITY_DN5182_c0_g7_i1.p1  ORF type:complete len:267 (+),score=70.18 TRINITY_DN5182_c0_g7_i1:57-857(+)
MSFATQDKRGVEQKEHLLADGGSSSDIESLESTITGKLQNVKRNNKLLEDVVSVIGTSEYDSSTGQQLRKAIQQNTDDLKQLKDLLGHLRQIKPSSKKQSDRQMMLTKKLTQFFQEEYDRFSNLVKKISSKEREYAESIKNGRRSDSLERQKNKVQDEENQMQMQQLDWDEEFMNEREKDIQQIGKATVELKGLMEQMSMQVNEQGQTLEVISSNVTSSKDNIKDSNKELTLANEYNRGSSRSLLMIFGILFIVLILIIIFVTARR